MARDDLLTRLADAGEEAIAKLGKAPGGDRMLGAVNSMRDRVDELQKRVRGIDELERRVSELEVRLEVLEGKRALPESTTDTEGAEEAADQTGEQDVPTSAAAQTTHSGSQAEPTGPATGGASQAGNPGDPGGPGT